MLNLEFPRDLMGLYGLLRDSRNTSAAALESLFTKAETGQGLTLDEVAALFVAPSEWSERIFNSATELNRRTKGKQITFYGVVYIHDYCINDCPYCGDSVKSRFKRRKVLSPEEFRKDVSSLLSRHDLKEICFLMGEAPRMFNTDDLVRYMKLLSEFYHEKIILNVPPLSVEEFVKIRKAVANRLHFRVFQETYDSEIYRREHLFGPKIDYDWRTRSQSRALDAGFDEAGHGVLYGLNDKPDGAFFETLAMIAHAQELHARYGRWSQSMSFPRLQPADGVSYQTPGPVSDQDLTRCVALVKLAVPAVDTVITCRESALFRRHLRAIVNIEDFAARPGPGGNINPEAHLQMRLPDMRSGEEVRSEMIADGYAVR